MPVTLIAHAIEKSTFAVVATFFDEEGAALTPNSGMTWTMTNDVGTVINSRTAVAISSAASVTIVLSGADLDLDDGRVRVVTVECTYDSDLGSNLPLKDQVTFFVDDLMIVS